MKAVSRQIVYVDTNVIIEATRAKCWAALLEHFDVRTVEEVRREAARGDNPANRDYIKADMTLFDAKVTVDPVTDAQILTAGVRSPGLLALDKGERELLAWAAAQDASAWLLTTADRAAVRTACELKMDARLKSLEELALQCGKKPKLKDWFTKAWLSQVKTAFLLGDM